MAILPELETARLTLRRLESDDAPFVVALLNEPSFRENIGDRGVRNVEDAHRYLRDGPMAMYARYGFGLWHVSRKSDGAAIGMCGLLKRDTLPDADLGYAYLSRRTGGRATRSRPPRPRCVTARRTSACDACSAWYPQGNTASIRVLEKVGMRFERMHAMDPGEPEVRLYVRDFSGA